MDKSTKKRAKYNALAVNKIAEAYGYSVRYVRQILKGDRKGLMADNVLRDYKKLANDFEKAVNEAVDNIINQ